MSKASRADNWCPPSDTAAWFRGFFPPLPEGYTIRWQVLPMFVDTYRVPKIDDPTKENSTTVVQGIANAKHR